MSNNSLEVLKQTDWFYKFLSEFCAPETVARLTCCSKKFHDIFSNDEIYEKLCLSLGFKQLSMTRTRGKKLWKQVFLSSLCIECKSYYKIIVLDINGGQQTRGYGTEKPSSSLIPLCYNCYKSVHDIPMEQRHKQKNCLVRTRLQLHSYRFSALLSTIPNTKTKKRKKKTTTTSTSTSKLEPYFKAAAENNYLVNNFKKSK